MDIMGPLPWSSAGHQYMLVIIDYATRYPEAFLLCVVTAPRIAEELVKWITQVGIPKEILTDQGQNFMSGILQAVYRTLWIKHLKTSVYHPQTNSLVECLNGTIKRMLRWRIKGDPWRWDLLLPLVLFTIQDMPQDSSKYSPFDLILGH